MIVKHLSEILGTDAHVVGETFESRRILLASDGLGYSLHDTFIKAGTEQHLHYKNHAESNYCFEGEGEVENVATGEVFVLKPGSIYVLNHHEAHILRARTDMRLVCVFTPALTGQEVHDKDGSYAAPE
ncbi:ectoine synthase [Roseovarius sp. EL26]|uniref:ectoine synthase n=1 Tax=Roseovarius sp. EL26 TaxID=2126672 RepID=UPI000EA03A17|nr:ectoine synthase [Roseovarius sp. EL26]